MSLFAGLIPPIDTFLVHRANVRLVTGHGSGGSVRFGELHEDVACFFEQASFKYEDRNASVFFIRAKFFFGPSLRWISQSEIVFGNDTYEAVLVNPVYAPDTQEQPHHWELLCR